jgi:hypothetical protein
MRTVESFAIDSRSLGCQHYFAATLAGTLIRVQEKLKYIPATMAPQHLEDSRETLFREGKAGTGTKTENKSLSLIVYMRAARVSGRKLTTTVGAPGLDFEIWESTNLNHPPFAFSTPPAIAIRAVKPSTTIRSPRFPPHPSRNGESSTTGGWPTQVFSSGGATTTLGASTMQPLLPHGWDNQHSPGHYPFLF